VIVFYMVDVHGMVQVSVHGMVHGMVHSIWLMVDVHG
jgi:hypothetical protein